MKKLTSILCAFSLLIAASSFTPPADDTVSAKVESALQKTFAPATDVRWKKLNEFYIATFKCNDQNFSAAFNDEGELISASRNISLSQLPLIVNLALQNGYAGYTIDNLVTELTVSGESSYYYIKAENKKHLITIKAGSGGTLSIENKTRK